MCIRPVIFKIKISKGAKWALSRREFNLRNNSNLIVKIKLHEIYQKTKIYVLSGKKIKKKICPQGLHAKDSLESV